MRFRVAALRTEIDETVTLDVHAEIDRSEWSVRWAKMGAGLNNRVTSNAKFVRHH